MNAHEQGSGDDELLGAARYGNGMSASRNRAWWLRIAGKAWDLEPNWLRWSLEKARSEGIERISAEIRELGNIATCRAFSFQVGSRGGREVADRTLGHPLKDHRDHRKFAKLAVLATRNTSRCDLSH